MDCREPCPLLPQQAPPSQRPDHDAWALAKAEVPRAKRGGNKRTVDVREVMNGRCLC